MAPISLAFYTFFLEISTRFTLLQIDDVFARELDTDDTTKTFNITLVFLT